MNDADRHDQIEALTALKDLLDDENADADDIRDAAIRAINRFDASIAAHGGWRPYSRRGSSDPKIRAQADRLGRAGVERHPEYRGRLRRRIWSTIAEIAITETRGERWRARPLRRPGPRAKRGPERERVADQSPRFRGMGPLQNDRRIVRKRGDDRSATARRALASGPHATRRHEPQQRREQSRTTRTATHSQRNEATDDGPTARTRSGTDERRAALRTAERARAGRSAPPRRRPRRRR